MIEQKDNLNESTEKPSESIVVIDADSPACHGMSGYFECIELDGG
jgi:hypothetical protein